MVSLVIFAKFSASQSTEELFAALCDAASNLYFHMLLRPEFVLYINWSIDDFVHDTFYAISLSDINLFDYNNRHEFSRV
jgi:hypothetical protein